MASIPLHLLTRGDGTPLKRRSLTLCRCYVMDNKFLQSVAVDLIGKSNRRPH